MSSTLAAASTSSSSSTTLPRCVPFAFRRGGERGRLPPALASSGTARTVAHGAPAAAAAGCCGRPLCRPAEVLGEGIQNAFFVSLDVCSCVKVRTDSFKESESESEAAPLMPPLPPHKDSGSAAAARRSGARRRASAGGKPRAPWARLLHAQQH